MEKRSPSEGEGRASPAEPPAPRQVPELRRGGGPAPPGEPPARAAPEEAPGHPRPWRWRRGGKGTRARGGALGRRDPRGGRGEEEEEEDDEGTRHLQRDSGGRGGERSPARVPRGTPASPRPRGHPRAVTERSHRGMSGSRGRHRGHRCRPPGPSLAPGAAPAATGIAAPGPPAPRSASHPPQGWPGQAGSCPPAARHRGKG